MEKLIDIVLHPIRMRIIVALAGREMTAQQLSETLGDVPPATLYRHINRLSEAGILTLAAERHVRGTLEKVYTLSRQIVQLDAQEFASLKPEDHLRYFTTFVATLLDDFSRYVNTSENLDLVSDGVGYHKLSLELNDEEFLDVVQKINAAIIPHLNNQPAPGRRRRLFTTIVMPDKQGNAHQDESAPNNSGIEC